MGASGTASHRLFVHKYPKTLIRKTPPEDFARNASELRRHQTLVSRVCRLCSDTLPEGIGASGAIFIDVVASHDDAGVVPPRG